MKTDEFQCLFLMYQRKLPLKNLENGCRSRVSPKNLPEHNSIPALPISFQSYALYRNKQAGTGFRGLICHNRIPAHYVYPQAFVQPGVVIPHVQPTAAASTTPYLDYTGAAYAQYSAAAAAAAAAAYDQYPYAASPAATGYVTTGGYGYAVQQPITAAAPGTAAAAAAAFGQYQPQQLQPDRMQ